MYRSQLDWRREAGLLPHGMQTLVLPDPGGRRIGSGGATLNALAQVAGLVAESDAGRLETLQRVLLIHSGGDSKRLPHCSATGKLFARVPRVLPGRPRLHHFRRVPHRPQRAGDAASARAC